MKNTAEIIKFPVPKKKKRALHSSGNVPLHFRYRDVYGTSREKTVYGKTEKEVLQKKAEFLAAVATAQRVEEQGRTVNSWMDEWLEVYKRPLVSEKRMQALGYEIKRIADAIGQRPLRAVTPSDLQRIVNGRIGMSQDAIRKTAGTIKAIFLAAVNNRLLIVSPADGLIIPPGPTGTHRSLTPDEINVAIKVAETHRFGPAVMCMLFAGLRRGEVADLHNKDIKPGHISVSRSVEYVVNQGRVKAPKSAAGIRDVPIMPPLKPFISNLSGFVVPRANDSTLSLQALRYGFDRFLRQCSELAGRDVMFRPHDLRHTYATMLYDAGVDIKTAQLWLGHASPSLTLKLYTHLSQARQNEAINAASDHFSRVAGCINGNTKKRYKLKSQ